MGLPLIRAGSTSSFAAFRFGGGCPEASAIRVCTSARAPQPVIAAAAATFFGSLDLRAIRP
jgi:hypothetical protein